MAEENNFKNMVDVLCVHYKSGHIKPLQVIWNDGRRFEVDKVISLDKHASVKSGGVGLRYTCRIHGQIRYLYLQDDNSWFIEKAD